MVFLVCRALREARFAAKQDQGRIAHYDVTTQPHRRECRTFLLLPHVRPGPKRIHWNHQRVRMQPRPGVESLRQPRQLLGEGYYQSVLRFAIQGIFVSSMDFHLFMLTLIVEVFLSF